jgi:hypothetical protein
VLDSLISAVLRFWCQSTTTKESPTVSTATDMTDDLWDEMVDDQPTSRRFCQTCDRDLAWHRHKVENLEETIGPIAAQEFEQDHPEVEGGIAEDTESYEPEWDDTKPTFNGHTEKALHEAFDKVKNRSNWKMPISRRVKRDENLFLIADAVIFFTGSVPEWIEEGRADKIRIVASGYYAAVGA